MGSKGGSDNSLLYYYLTQMQNQGATYTDPVDSTVYSTPEDLNAHIAARTAQAATDAATAKQTAADEAAAKESAFQTSKTNAQNAALNNVLAEFTRQGIDPSQYRSTDIDPTIARYASTIQDLDPNPSAAFSSTLGSDIINSIQSGKRQQNVDLFNQTFTPTYSQTALPYSAADPYVTSLVAEQFDPLSTQLTNAQKRGTLNDQGYAAALSALTNKKQAATSTVNSLARGVIGEDRSALDDYLSGARTSIGNLSLNASNAFDPSSYRNAAEGMVNTDLSSLGGDIRGKIGDSQYATLSDLMNAGGASQGATNPVATGQTGTSTGGTSPTVISQEEQARRRGIGSTGSF